MSADQRRTLILSRHNQLLKHELDWRAQLRRANLLTNLYRLGFLLVVVGVLTGLWVVSSAHLTEQFLGAPRTAAGLIDPTVGRGALTPDNVEKQVLTWSLRLR